MSNNNTNMGYEIAIITNLIGISALFVLMGKKIKDDLKLIQPLLIGIAFWFLIGVIGIAHELINLAGETTLYDMFTPFYRIMVWAGYFVIAYYIFFVLIIQAVQWLGGRKKADVRM